MFGRDSVVICPSLRQPLTVRSTVSHPARQTGRRAPSASGQSNNINPEPVKRSLLMRFPGFPVWHQPFRGNFRPTSDHYYRPMQTREPRDPRARTVVMTSVGILGGTGPQGRGLARRLSAAGHEVVIGSRSVERAQVVADRYAAEGHVRGGSNQEAAAAHLVIVAVPYDGHAELLASLRNDLA